MTQLALDKTTNDLFKPSGGGVSRVSKGRFVVQQVQSKLNTTLGEWILDDRIGYVNTEDFIKNFDKFDLETRAREIILNTQGVNSIISLTSTYKDRRLEITFKADTIYGEIDSTIPWDNTGEQI